MTKSPVPAWRLIRNLNVGCYLRTQKRSVQVTQKLDFDRVSYSGIGGMCCVLLYEDACYITSCRDASLRDAVETAYLNTTTLRQSQVARGTEHISISLIHIQVCDSMHVAVISTHIYVNMNTYDFVWTSLVTFKIYTQILK